MYVDHKAKEIHELFIQVRDYYNQMLILISRASKIDSHLSQDIFNLSPTDALLLKQDVIDDRVISEVTDKNNLMFTIYMPEQNIINKVLLDKQSDFSGFDTDELGQIASSYNDIQVRVVLAAKKIIDISPIVGQQLFDLDDDCTEIIKNIDLEDLFNLSARYVWLVVINNKRSWSVFNDTVSLRNQADRGIVDSAINY
jgi:hypothetical protein